MNAERAVPQTSIRVEEKAADLARVHVAKNKKRLPSIGYYISSLIYKDQKRIDKNEQRKSSKQK